MGDSYCGNVVRRTHRSAAILLREIAPRYPNAKRHLDAAAAEFEKEADILDTAENLLGWNVPEGPDAERNRKTAAILAEAAAHYAAGIAGIERAVDPMGNADAGIVGGNR